MFVRKVKLCNVELSLDSYLKHTVSHRIFDVSCRESYVAEHMKYFFRNLAVVGGSEIACSFCVEETKISVAVVNNVLSFLLSRWVNLFGMPVEDSNIIHSRDSS